MLLQIDFRRGTFFDKLFHLLPQSSLLEGVGDKNFNLNRALSFSDLKLTNLSLGNTTSLNFFKFSKYYSSQANFCSEMDIFFYEIVRWFHSFLYSKHSLKKFIRKFGPSGISVERSLKAISKIYVIENDLSNDHSFRTIIFYLKIFYSNNITVAILTNSIQNPFKDLYVYFSEVLAHNLNCQSFIFA